MKRITLTTIQRAVEAQDSDAEKGMVERALLDGAFRLVQNAGHWKDPIEAMLIKEACEYDPEVIKRAVMFFTSTEATITECGGPHTNSMGEPLWWQVTAAGYRAGPAGDQ